MRFLLVLLLLLGGGCTNSSEPPAPNTPSPSSASTDSESHFRFIGDFTEAGVATSHYTVANIPADRLDIIVYAHVDAAADGTVKIVDKVTAASSIPALQALKKTHPALKTVVAVGGWSHSSQFSVIARDPALRTHFCNDLVKFMLEQGFDGISLDWEFPLADGLTTNTYSPDDPHNLTLLVEELRSTMSAQAKGTLLSVVLPGEASRLSHFEIAQLVPQVDWFNLMAYNFHGPWEIRTGNASPIYRSKSDPSDNAATTNVDAAVQTVVKAGSPPGKIVLGVPFYGRQWRGVRPLHQGLFQRAHTVMDGWRESGVISFVDIDKMATNIYERHLDPEAQARYIYAPTVDSGLFISYDDARIVAEKASYAHQHRLGGMMCSALSDDPSGALLDAMHKP